MRATDRARRAGLAAAMAAVIGGGGVAACAAARAPAASPQTAAAVPSSAPGSAGSGAAASYAPAVRNVLPSVVLIHTAGGLGSGVVLDRHGNIVTNAHVAGTAKSFQVQLAGDPAPRPARLVGTYRPGDLARDIAGQIIASGHVTNSHRAALGAEVTTAAGADGAPAGAAVVAVTPGGPAERAGLRPGDVIHRLGPAPALDATTLLEALAAAQPGQEVQVTITRAGQTHTVPVTLGTLRGG